MPVIEVKVRLLLVPLNASRKAGSSQGYPGTIGMLTDPFPKDWFRTSDAQNNAVIRLRMYADDATGAYISLPLNMDGLRR